MDVETTLDARSEGARAIILPFEPPLATTELTGIGGRIGSEPEDFVVDEVPLYAASGDGQHHYVRLRKRSLTTQQLIEAVARAAGIDRREIGSAGMKDKHAVTSQWLSVPLTCKQPPESWQLPPSIEVVEVTRHDNKLRTGHLLGNRFSIRLVGVEAEQLEARIAALTTRLGEQGLLNFFGAQRFGLGGQNLRRAIDWLGQTSRRRDRFEAKLYPSVIQSEVFNRYLALRREAGLQQLLLGDVVRLEGSGACFVVRDVEQEQPRLEARDIHLTGPMFGPKMRASEQQALQLEVEAHAALGLDDAAIAKLGRLAPGTRRDLIAPIDSLAVVIEEPADVRLSFSLPAGSYATQLVREFTRQPFLDDLRSRDDQP